MTSGKTQKKSDNQVIIENLKNEISSLKIENSELKKQLVRNDIPEHVRTWMREYEMYYSDIFWCTDHQQWYTELDQFFPYYLSWNECPECIRVRENKSDGQHKPQ